MLKIIWDSSAPGYVPTESPSLYMIKLPRRDLYNAKFYNNLLINAKITIG